MAASISVTLRNTGGSVVAGQVRSHAVTVDRPVEKGGSDQGPMGGELLLLGLGGCFFSTFIATLRADHPELTADGVAITVTGDLESEPSRFARIRVQVVAPLAGKDALGKSFLKAERGCLVHNTLKTGTDVQFDYQWVSV